MWIFFFYSHCMDTNVFIICPEAIPIYVGIASFALLIFMLLLARFMSTSRHIHYTRSQFSAHFMFISPVVLFLLANIGVFQVPCIWTGCNLPWSHNLLQNLRHDGAEIFIFPHIFEHSKVFTDSGHQMKQFIFKFCAFKLNFQYFGDFIHEFYQLECSKECLKCNFILKIDQPKFQITNGRQHNRRPVFWWSVMIFYPEIHQKSCN